MMTDAELAKGLGLTDAEASVVIPKLTPAKRAPYERMLDFSVEWNLYAAGLGSVPAGEYLVDTERSVRRRKGWR